MDTLLTIPRDILVITLIISFLLGMTLGVAIALSIFTHHIANSFKRGTK